jgi:hypothetical protein
MRRDGDASAGQPGAIRLFDATWLRETTLDVDTAAIIHLGADGRSIVRISVSRSIGRCLYGQIEDHMVAVHRVEAIQLRERVARCAVATCTLAISWLPALTGQAAAGA